MRLKFYEFKRRAVLKKPKCIIDIIRFKRKTWCRKKLPYTFNNYWKKYFSQTKHIFVLVNTVKCMSGGEMLKRGFNLVSKKKNLTKLPVLLRVSCFGDVLHLLMSAHLCPWMGT